MRSVTTSINKTAWRFAYRFIVLLCALMVMPAYGQFSGYYGEIFYGSGETEFSFFTDLSDFNGDSDFYGITVGRTFNDNISAEVSYVELGESEAVISDPVIATLNSELDARALAVTAVGTYPLSRNWNIFGKLGLNQWDLEASVTDDRFVPAISLSGDDGGTGIHYGVGLQYRFTRTYSIKLEYLVYQLNTELFDDDIAIGGPTIALRYNY